MKKLLLLALLPLSLFALTLHQTPPHVVIKGEDGGLVKGDKGWDSSSLHGNVFVLFYVDPDKKDTNEHYIQALKKFKKQNNLHFQSVAIINLAATWKPNFVIEKILASKQKEFPKTIYVKDKHSVLVKKWGIADNNADVIIVGKDGKVLFYKAGAMSAQDIKKSFQIIKDNL